MARHWSRDGRTEIDLVAELDDGTFLFWGMQVAQGERDAAGLGDLSTLQAKAASLPEARWPNTPSCVLFALGGFSRELVQLAADPAERLHLVAEADMLRASR